MREKRRKPEVPDEEVPGLDCRARITSKELAPIHSVKKRHPPEFFFTRPRVVVGLGKSALMRTDRLKNSLAKGPKRMMSKCSSHVEEE